MEKTNKYFRTHIFVMYKIRPILNPLKKIKINECDINLLEPFLVVYLMKFSKVECKKVTYLNI